MGKGLLQAVGGRGLLGLQSLTLALESICFELMARRCCLLPEQPCTQGCPVGWPLPVSHKGKGPAVYILPGLSQGSKGLEAACSLCGFSLGWPDFVLPKVWRGV